MITVAYQGEPGAYSESAALQFFSPPPGGGPPRQPPDAAIQLLPTPSFGAMLDALTSATATHAAMPIENSLAGTIHPNLDLLLANPNVSIVGETDFRVRHCLLGTADAAPGVSIKRVHSHYMALAQCTGYLAGRGLTQVVAADTAGAARALSLGQLSGDGKDDAGSGVRGEEAVIASRRAGDIYGLTVLEEGVEDDAGNYTRFLILTGGGVGVSRGVGVGWGVGGGGAVKTSVAFTLRNVAGELFRALSVFAVSGADLTKVESRHVATLRLLTEGSNGHGDGASEVVVPLTAAAAAGGKAGTLARDGGGSSEEPERRWGYIFYVDVAHVAGDEGVRIALMALANAALFFRVLGTYPRCGP